MCNEKDIKKTMAYLSYLFGIKIELFISFIDAGVLKGVGMVAYEFYWRDETGDAHLVGILPERRKDPTRINDKSIMNWVKKVIGNDIRLDDVFFSKVTVNEF